MQNLVKVPITFPNLQDILEVLPTNILNGVLFAQQRKPPALRKKWQRCAEKENVQPGRMGTVQEVSYLGPKKRQYQVIDEEEHSQELTEHSKRLRSSHLCDDDIMQKVEVASPKWP